MSDMISSRYHLEIVGIIYKGYWSRDVVKNDYQSLYLFGENLEHTSGYNHIEVDDNTSYHVLSKYKQKKYPSSTQAVIRGLNNAMPIYTKKGKSKDEFFDETEEDFDLFKSKNNKAIGDVIEVFNKGFMSGDKFCTPLYIRVPEDGFASGKARLPLAFAEHLASTLNMLFTSFQGRKLQFKVVKSNYYNEHEDSECTNWYSIKPYYA